MVHGKRITASFRDPGGFLFEKTGVLYRQINASYKNDYETFVKGGLYDRLIADGLLISHREANVVLYYNDVVYKVIQPTPVKFITYPFEWSFSQPKMQH